MLTDNGCWRCSFKAGGEEEDHLGVVMEHMEVVDVTVEEAGDSRQVTCCGDP